MSLIVVLLRIALSAVFGVAGVTKLLDLGGTRDALKNFGAPLPLIPALALLLPFIELTVAVALLVDNYTSAGAMGALALLGVFVFAISVNLAQGRTHDCHCFGQLHSRPLGWSTLIRNIIFALGAGFVLWQSRDDAALVPTLLSLGLIPQLMLTAAVVLVVAMLALWQQRAKRAQAEEIKSEPAPAGLPLNSVAPAFQLAAYHGGAKSLADLITAGKPLLLIFTSPTCGPCVSLFQEIKGWQRTHSDRLTIGLISRGTIKDNFVNVARNNLGEVLLQEEREVAELYNARVTPTAVVVDTRGRIASPLAAGADQIRILLNTVLENLNGHTASGARQEP